MAGKIGILALQGGFSKHQQILHKLHIPTQQVKYPIDLRDCKGLIIPGGESSVMAHLIRQRHLLEPLKTFAQTAPLFGTCAGMILMAQKETLNCLSIDIERNAYGRQKDSFTTELNLSFSSSSSFHAVFIRAPKIKAILSEQVAILATHHQEPVLVQQGKHLAASFHPELTNDPLIHHYFVQLCKEKQSPPQQLKITPTKSFQTI